MYPNRYTASAMKIRLVSKKKVSRIMIEENALFRTSCTWLHIIVCWCCVWLALASSGVR
ncbi:hypothetical protein IF1G_00429 [Cordyceps javanica]|uniref:Uncharacterized protein n=1 Tax=Cordyceps javanica TaxID=43265 RepID=A0A545VFI1_9HYPO|nr:hypothetical protein IF1G_00429 [Cordyceps javanica]